MMLRAACSLWCLLGLSFVASANDGFESLFNGRDLSGWDGDPALWRVEDGAITGQTKDPKDLQQNQFLIWTGGTVDDFELKLEFRMEGANNSGVQYRSRRLPDVAPWVVGGYQIDIHPNPANLGMLYEERGRGTMAKRGKEVVFQADGKKQTQALGGSVDPVDLSQWHELAVVAQGNNLTHLLDGVTVVKVEDLQSDKRSHDGIIALQLHRGPAMKIQFRNIQLKRLPKVAAVKAVVEPAPVTEREPVATPVDRMKTLDGFQVERLYSVPGKSEGSWVCMCADPRGRLIVADQQGALYRIQVPGLHGVDQTKVELLDIPIAGAQGLCWAFDSLYVVGNRGKRFPSGLYRVSSSQNDDRLDKCELLRELSGGGEHGPHAVLPAPDGQSLYVLCGNQTPRTEFSSSRVKENWDEDVLLPRLYGKGFMKGVPAPGGWVAKVDPDGKNWELVTVGFRNQYDAAFNADGDLFTFDADMEWDLSTPWYRPTRVCQVLSGVDYGWRNGSAKLLEHFPDTPAPVVNIGPGSPTGVSFGYGARFPAKYQKALFLCDWSYGKLYAAHLQPSGSSYSAEFEEFLTGTPLPLTDLVINPLDGAMYFTIGGRQVQSGLYRVRYTGTESTAVVDAVNSEGAQDRKLLKQLQSLHLGDHPQAVELSWPSLSDSDRVLRTAARIAIEHRPIEEWFNRAIQEPQPQARLEALLAACRVQIRKTRNLQESVDAETPDWNSEVSSPTGIEADRQAAILESLKELEWDSLNVSEQRDLLRVLQLALLRYGPPSYPVRNDLLEWFEPRVKAYDPLTNSMLLDLLVYLQSPNAAQVGMGFLQQAVTQEEELDYARALAYLRTGWTEELQRTYFHWFAKAHNFRGGASFAKYVNDVKQEALSHLSQDDSAAMSAMINSLTKEENPVASSTPRPFVKAWTMDELQPLLESRLTNRDFAHGREMFSAANCFTCHRFNGEGGALGPDLTGLAGRFDHRAILESVLDPSRVISDQYAAVQIETTDGQIIIGRIANHSGTEMVINTNMLDPRALVRISTSKVEEMAPSKTSMMPSGLLDSLTEEEVLDLMAFLLSRGDPRNPMFQASPQAHQ